MSHISLAGCILKDESDNILLIHRNTPKRTQWEIPGGKIEARETPAETAIREVKEELGIEVAITQKVGSCTFKEDSSTFHYIWFGASITGGTPHIMEPHLHDDLRYFPLEMLSTMKAKLPPNTRSYIEKCALL